MDKKYNVSLQLGYMSNGLVYIEIRDRDSSLVLLQIDLTPEDFRNLLSSMNIEADAFILHEAARHRIGKKLTVSSMEIPESIRPKYNETTAPGLQDWVDNLVASEGWDEANIYHHNDGWKVHLRKWVVIER